MIQICQDEGILLPKAEDPNRSALNEFRKWWSSSSNHGPRNAFLRRELEYAVSHEPHILVLAAKDGVIVQPGDSDAQEEVSERYVNTGDLIWVLS